MQEDAQTEPLSKAIAEKAESRRIAEPGSGRCLPTDWEWKRDRLGAESRRIGSLYSVSEYKESR